MLKQLEGSRAVAAAVTIKDAGADPGGMMRYGIPKYRLPREILDAELNRILDMGVNLELNTKVTDILAEFNEAADGHASAGGGFGAAFVAVGAHIGKRACTLAPDRLDAAAGDAGRDDADEQLPLPAGPGLDARLLSRCALGLGVDVVRGPLDQYAPALAADHVELVDLERHLVIAAGDAGLQVLVEGAVPGGPEHDRPVVPLVVHRQHGRAEPAHVSDAADSARRYQP
jgi:hypothetical protein